MSACQAYCEQCEVSLEVPAEELLEFDCRCPTCDAVLVLVADAEEDEEELEEPLDVGRELADTDDELEPAFDEFGTDVIIPPQEPLPELIENELRPAMTTKLLRGSGPLAPPLPAWDGGDTSELKKLARESERGQDLPPPVDFGGDLEDDFEEVRKRLEAEVLQQKAAPAPPLPAPTRAPPDPHRTRTWAEVAQAQSPAPAPSSPEPSRPEGGVLFPHDPDWEALLDESLPELEADDPDAKRVFIRLPATAALQDGEDFSRLEGVFGSFGLATPGKHVKTAPKTEKLSVTGAKPQTRRWNNEEREAQAVPTDAIDGETQGWDALQAQEPRAAAPPPKSSRGSRTFARAATPPPPLKVVEAVQFHQLDQALVCVRNPESVEAESYLQLYQRLLGRSGNGAAQVILVTSPERRDGRTTVAANLTLVAARIPNRLGVLVDADTRGRGALTPFGLQPSSTGLLNVLRSRGDPRRFVIQFRLGDLDVVPLGTPGRDAGQLLCSEDMGHYIEELRDLYPGALIVIDGAPVLHSASPLAISRHVDGVLLVVRSGVTERRHVRQAAQILGQDRILGVVLNDA